MNLIQRRAASEPRYCLAIGLQGDVQGSGVRPAIANLAAQLGLAGTVRNSRQGVEVKVVGPTTAIARFRRSLRLRYPLATQTWAIALDDGLPHDFQILPSAAEGAARFTVPLDRVVCKACLDECLSPGDRRFGYALNSCAQCGPRYSIIAKMPYDRDQTSSEVVCRGRE